MTKFDLKTLVYASVMYRLYSGSEHLYKWRSWSWSVGSWSLEWGRRQPSQKMEKASSELRDYVLIAVEIQRYVYNDSV